MVRGCFFPVAHYWSTMDPTYYQAERLEHPMAKKSDADKAREDRTRAAASETERVREAQKETPTNVTAEERNLAEAAAPAAPEGESDRGWNNWGGPNDPVARDAREAAERIGHETTPDPHQDTPDVEEPVKPYSR